MVPVTQQSRIGSEPKRVRFGIRWVVTAVTVCLTAAAVLGVGAFQERSTRRALTSELEARLLLEARNLSMASTSALLSDFPELTLHPLLKEKKERNPEFVLLVVLDHEAKIQGHPEFRRLGESLAIDQGLVPHTSTQKLEPGEEFLEGADIIAVTAPVRFQDREIGRCAVGIARGYVDGILKEARGRLFAALGGFLLLAVGVASATMTGLLAPVADLRKGIERIGRGDLSNPIRVRDRNELGMLADTVNVMASELKRAQAEMVEKERLAHELELAREIQSRLLPHEVCSSGSFVIEGSHQAAFEVGGDYYDYFVREDGRIGIVMADVAGKGLAGCLVMSMLSASLKAYRDRFDSPSELLAALDESLSPDLRPGTFVTMFFGILDPATGLLRFASAGHMPTLVYRASGGGVEEHRTRAIPIGAVRGGVVARTLHDEQVVLEPGDLLVQYTDGVNETMDKAGVEQYEVERMKELLGRRAESGAADVLASFRSELESWRGGGPREDDETLVVVSRELPVPAGGTIVSGNEDANGSSDPKGDSGGDVTPLFEAVPEEEGPLDEVASLRWLQLARSVGERLVLGTDLDGLSAIESWAERRVDLEAIDRSHFDLLVTALYEACANVAEHGYGHAPARFELWWVPARAGRQSDDACLGRFVIRDEGRAFVPDTWNASDFNDPIVRRRTRGFGLDIIHRVMCEVSYRPGTEEGNITVLAFDPSAMVMKEVRHA